MTPFSFPKSLRCFWLAGILLLSSTGLAQEIPSRISYCEMDLSLTQGAKEKLEHLVEAITLSPRYFNQMVGRAQMYMPFIDEAFDDAGIPHDLKYLAIQESSLQPSVVSSSNAVGFWQFKAPTGLELGLRIDERIDERQHIFRASEAAAGYLKKANRDFDNWIYAVIAYYEGPTGAVAHTDPTYYSQRSMLIDENCHWYVLKAIAHKLAYELPLQEAETADWYLKPYSTAGETHLNALIAEHGISSTEFFKYNSWLLDKKRVPRSERPFTYYLPVRGDKYTGHRQDPTKGPIMAVKEEVEPVNISELAEQPEPDPSQWTTPAPTEMVPPTVTAQSPAPGPPIAVSTSQLHSHIYAEFPVEADLHYGESYITYTGEQSLPNLAILVDVTYGELVEWNQLKPGQEPEIGQVIYLAKPKKADYHVVRPGETLAGIASLHGTTTRKVQRKNRMKSSNLIIFEGQKLHLKKKKPAAEKLIILVTPEPKVEPVKPKPQTRQRVVTQERIRKGPAPMEQRDLEPVEVEPQVEEKRIWIEHPVEAGETLWQISQRYDTKVAIIQRINNLETDSIQPGQILHILVRKTVLEDIAREAASRGAEKN